MSKKNKFTRQNIAFWMLPGVYFKRWLLSLMVGLSFALIGTALLLNLHPVASTIHFIENLAPVVPAWLSGAGLLGLGALLVFLGWRKTTQTVFDAMGSPWQNQGEMIEALYRRSHLEQGPKIVAIGGGTGLSTLLRGLKAYTSNITAVVTVGDDGGSSGRIREEFGIIPPGDIRNCIAALADEENLTTSLFQYRFKSGTGLEGHSFGNLFLSVMCDITGDMMHAIKESSRVLNIRGRVLPATLDNIKLVAKLVDGTEIVGESNIPESECEILQLRTEPLAPTALPEVIDAIEDAEIIILGPGSLYTSVLPNLLIPGILDALSRSKAPKVYVCNVMTQPGETSRFSAADHIQVLINHCPNRHIVDNVVVNNWIPLALVEKYAQVGSVPVEIDTERLHHMNIDVIERVLVDDGEVIRHNSRKLARAIVTWFKRYQRHQARKTPKHSNLFPNPTSSNSGATTPTIQIVKNQ